MPFKEPNAIQLRVTLAEIEPPIWRQLIVPRTFTLGQLHHVIQAAFGWLDYHLHQFIIGGLRFGDYEQVGEPEFEGDTRAFDETEVRLLDFGFNRDVRFVYEYDFGDGWEHVVEFEQLLKLDPPPRVARCLGGARARPPEDVGGAYGYADFLEIITDPDHPEHDSMRTWAGGHFDPEWFDLKLVNSDVRAALTGKRPLRTHQSAAKARRKGTWIPPTDLKQ